MRLVDYGGTLIFVSHDRYFVERLATKIIEVGHGHAIMYPGTYQEFLWHKEHSPGQEGQDLRLARRSAQGRRGGKGRTAATKQVRAQQTPQKAAGGRRLTKRNAPMRKRGRKRAPRKLAAPGSKRSKPASPRREQAIRDIESAMAVPGFYDDRAAAQTTIDRHQALMWKVGDLMHQWEELQSTASLSSSTDVNKIEIQFTVLLSW